MSRKEHPVWEEELMPYVDGELDATQASSIEEHLKECGECAAVVADARGLSRQMATWEVENPSGKVDRIAALLRSQPRYRWAWWTTHRAWAYGAAGAFAVVLIAVGVNSSLRSPGSSDEVTLSWTQAQDSSSPQSEVRQGDTAALKKEKQGRQGQGQGQQGDDLRSLFQLELSQEQAATDTPSGPMVIRTARLTILTKEFDSARSRIQAIVQQAQGYLDQLTVRGETGSGKSLSATLRLPSDRIDSGLTELRKLGKVLEESQNSSEVTSQYVDLEARLKNARNTEQRLLALQRERTDKLTDVVGVEREIARVREEIERMEAQRKDVFNKTQYATIQVELSEEYRAELQPSTPSARTQLRNALIDGYHGALNSLLALALLTLRYGPALLLWSIVLLPVGLLLRRRLQGIISWKS